MEYRRFGNKIVVRIDMGEDMFAALKTLAEKEKILLAEVGGLGTFSHMNVGVYDLNERRFKGNDFRRHVRDRIADGNHQHDERRILCSSSRVGGGRGGQCIRRPLKRGDRRSDHGVGDHGDRRDGRPGEGR